MRAPSRQLPFVLLVAMAICINSIGCEQAQNFKESTNFNNQNEEQQLAVSTLAALNRADGLSGQSSSPRANSRLLAVPLSLARFMFPHSRQASEQYQLIASSGGGGGGGGSFGVSNSKRSASQMAAAPGPDILIGSGGLGKRSVPLDSMNLEPTFERATLVRGSPPVRGYQLRIPMYDLDSY